jgi:hypothetical protein
MGFGVIVYIITLFLPYGIITFHVNCCLSCCHGVNFVVIIIMVFMWVNVHLVKIGSIILIIVFILLMLVLFE